ncbi:MAG: DUF2786 domain-containing protein [Burkholderiaceae bacterium]
MDEKIIERIRKLYAMSQDVSSPNEAAVAARRCRKLMDEHNIQARDLETSPFGAEIGRYANKRLPGWISAMALGVAKLNDVLATGVPGGVRFDGFEQDCLAARLMLDYLVSACDWQCQVYLAYHRDARISGRASGGSFRNGFASEIQNRLLQMADEREAQVELSDGRSLVLVKMGMVQSEFGVQRTTTRKSAVYSKQAYGAGQEAGSNTGLNTQIKSG